MKISKVKYPTEIFTMSRYNHSPFVEKIGFLSRYMQLAAEYGVTEEAVSIAERFINGVDDVMSEFQQAILSTPVDQDEPDDLETIRKLRPEGPRKLLDALPADYAERVRGAFYGRMAGCTLGAAVEFLPIDSMIQVAEKYGDEFPPTDYWIMDPHPMPDRKHYIVGHSKDLSRSQMDAVPPDDDTMYTLVGLFAMEKYGTDIGHDRLAEIWKQYVPLGGENGGERGCWWGERVMLKNLHAGIPFPEAGLKGNPNLQNIAAWTRADSFGYACPGWPEKAAELAYIDASMNHRRNGVYGSMFMAATIAAAFAVDDPMEAVRIGLSEIPKDCMFAEGIRWALDNQGKFKNYREAADATWEIYNGMFNGSALTNAIHVVTGLDIGGKDFTKTIGETIAMSGDNDCTGATAGSIVGAVIGLKNIPEHWYRPFNGRMHCYLNDIPEYLDIEEVCDRFEALARKFSQ